MTCVISISWSSTTTEKLYVGKPSERTRMKSPSDSFRHVTSPRIMSSIVTSPSSGTWKRSANGVHIESFVETCCGVRRQHVPS